MAAIALACLAAILFGALSLAVHFGLQRCGDIRQGATVMTATAFVATVAVGVASGSDLAIFDADLWPYAVAGTVAPGASQIAILLAVRDAGPARTTTLVGASPLISGLLAVGLLGEDLHVALVVGTVLIVLGIATLAHERSRPERFRRIGALLALLCAVLYAVRDNIVRWGSEDATTSSLDGAVVTLAAGTAVLFVYMLATRRRAGAFGGWRTAAFIPAGIVLALAFEALLAALNRGKVTVVSPLSATQALWAVAFAAVFLGRREAVSRKLVLSAVLIVAGSALIGATQ